MLIATVGIYLSSPFLRFQKKAYLTCKTGLKVNLVDFYIYTFSFTKREHRVKKKLIVVR